ncbi:hypothetical protein JJB28_09970, partial [Campylobacter fetus subsp. venerealis]|nr:hypothetical protein [Campylobacter fetus subsp. venerealis]
CNLVFTPFEASKNHLFKSGRWRRRGTHNGFQDFGFAGKDERKGLSPCL